MVQSGWGIQSFRSLFLQQQLLFRSTLELAGWLYRQIANWMVGWLAGQEFCKNQTKTMPPNQLNTKKEFCVLFSLLYFLHTQTSSFAHRKKVKYKTHRNVGVYSSSAPGGAVPLLYIPRMKKKSIYIQKKRIIIKFFCVKKSFLCKKFFLVL